MSIKTLLLDGEGTGYTAGVTESRALKVQALPRSSKGIPPEDLANLRLLKAYLTDALGSFSMNVDASSNMKEFFIAAEEGLTKWITSLRILINGTNFDLTSNGFRKFGTAYSAGLANGIVIETFQSGAVTKISAQPIKFAGDLLNYASSHVNYIKSVSSKSDFLSVDFSFDVPIVLTEGSTDKLYIKLFDDLSSLDLFTAIVSGYQEFL